MKIETRWRQREAPFWVVLDEACLSCLLRSYKSAVVLCDMEWVDPDLRVANGIAISDQGDMLRLDAMLMTVQLNLRKMLEVRRRPGG